MRYMAADNETFTDSEGRTVSLKAWLEWPGRAARTVAVASSARIALDEVATRDVAYGPGSESEAYRIFDENAVELVEAGFDPGLLAMIRIPL